MSATFPKVFAVCEGKGLRSGIVIMSGHLGVQVTHENVELPEWCFLKNNHTYKTDPCSRYYIFEIETKNAFCQFYIRL